MHILLLEKYIRKTIKKDLLEQEKRQQKAEKALFLIYRFPGLKKTIEGLMSPAFGRYISNIILIAPKPTTFKIELINDQDFNITYIGKGNFITKISGKKYDPLIVSEAERASQAIADLLELNYTPVESTEEIQSTKAKELEADLAGLDNKNPFEKTETPPKVTEPEAPTSPEKKPEEPKKGDEGEPIDV